MTSAAPFNFPFKIFAPSNPHSMFSSSFEVLVRLLKATEASIHLGALLSEGIFQASLHPILCLAKGGSWQPWRRSLSFGDCLNVLKGNQTKVCKSLRIGSKVLKTIGMQTHGEKNSCSTVQPCFNTHGREFLAGSPLPHPCSQSVVAGWLWCLANQAPWHQLGPRVPGAQAWVMATSQGVAAAQGIWEQHASMGTHSSGCDTFCWWKVANYNSIQNFVKTQEWMSKPTDPPSPTWYSQVRPLKWL